MDHSNNGKVREDSEKKSSILHTASNLFAQYGYHNVGVDRIIAESGVAKKTMYSHFSSKDLLIEDVLHRRMESVHEAIDSAIKRHANPSDKLKAIFEWHHAWFQDPEFRGCMFMHAAAEFGDPSNRIHRVAEAQKAQLTDQIKDILHEAGYRSAASTKLSKALVMLLDGAIVSAEVSKNYRAAREAWSIAQALLEANKA